MNFRHLISSSSPHKSRCKNPSTLPWQKGLQQPEAKFLKSSALFGCGFSYPQLEWQKQSNRGVWELGEVKTNNFVVNNLGNKPVKIVKKKGTIAGAVALIIGTSIGTGILALPQKTSPAGLIPSSITMTLCWAFLLLEAILLVEINVVLQRRKKSKVDSDELEVMSIRTMAQETLGEWGGSLATLFYVFLGYTFLFTILTCVGGTRTTDQVNQWLTASMIGLLVGIEVFAVVFGGWSGFEAGGGDWGKIPATLPVMVFALVYHDLAPVLCAYLEGDLARIRASLVLGSVVPLVTLLVWDAIVLGLSNGTDQVSDPVDLLLRVR